MANAIARCIHGFAVPSVAFTPLLKSLRRRSIDATLCRYPSLGRSLDEIVDRVAGDLANTPSDGIVAHSLGCVATLLAVQRLGWTGSIVFLAPPMSVLASTYWIPKRLRWPFAPLLDHREHVALYPLSAPRDGCRVLAIAGRYDMVVPLSKTRSDVFDEYKILPLTHNGLLFSTAAAELTADWLTLGR